MNLETLRSTCARLAAVCVVVLGAATSAAADSITLEWNPNESPVGYKVHVGVQSGSYTQHFDVGASTLFTFPAAIAGQRYCFAVSAYLLSSLVEGPNSNEVCGYSNAPPTLANPGNRSSMTGQTVTLQLEGSDPDGQAVTYSATGLPPGLSLMQSTGFISGTGTTAGTFSVTARASDSILSASQTFTWTMATAADITRPTASITAPTGAASYSTTGSTLNLGGAASDNVSVAQVRWSNDRGGSGVAAGTTSWSVAGVPLQSGTNNIVVTAVDAAGNQGMAMLSVTRSTTPSDTTPPLVSIGSPTTGSTFSSTSATINLTGSASDNVGVTQVRWTNDRGGNGIANGTTSWAIASIPLAAGTNIITVTGVDGVGNPGTDSLTVAYSGTTTPPPPPSSSVVLTVQRTGVRTVRLTWTTAPWSSINVYRNDERPRNTANDGAYNDSLPKRGGTYTYKICAPGVNAPCSNTATITF